MPDILDKYEPHRDALSSAVLEKVTGENRVRNELAKGRSVREVFAEYGIL